MGGESMTQVVVGESWRCWGSMTVMVALFVWIGDLAFRFMGSSGWIMRSSTNNGSGMASIANEMREFRVAELPGFYITLGAEDLFLNRSIGLPSSLAVCFSTALRPSSHSIKDSQGRC